jgi:hypothetical protein
MNEVITLVVGKEGEAQKSFAVHRSILCSNSPSFTAACKPEWLKDDHVTKLPEDEVEIIEIVVNWYGQILVNFLESL